MISQKKVLAALSKASSVLDAACTLTVVVSAREGIKAVLKRNCFACNLKKKHKISFHHKNSVSNIEKNML